jgi:hypothetical protein
MSITNYLTTCTPAGGAGLADHLCLFVSIEPHSTGSVIGLISTEAVGFHQPLELFGEGPLAPIASEIIQRAPDRHQNARGNLRLYRAS